MKAVPPAAPSTRAQIQKFSELQNNPDHAIHCNRPQSASHPIPVTLLHPIFGQFKDECETHTPTCEDNTLVLEMSRIMSAIYPDEESRQRGVFRLFERYDIPMHRSDIQGASYSTDAGITHRDFPLAIAKIENEVGSGSGSADPYAQAAFYYLESTREHWALKYPASPLPSIIITIFGPYLSFSGAVWDHRPCVQVLSAAIPFHFHQSDTDIKSMAARQLGAFRKAVQRLREYYIDIVPRLKNVPAPHDKLFPHPTRFASLMGPREDRDFRYSSRQSDEGFVFFGSLFGDNTDICVKFVRHYSSVTHQYFADLGLAPRLLGFEPLSGGWKMVVMDRVDREYMDLYSSTYDIDHPIDGELRIALYKTLYSSLARLHKAGLVHGDIRAPNIMIPKNREAKFMLLDFDWAGEIGVARYPANVYRGYKLWRPDGVFDGAPIAAIHDIQMLDHIFTVEVPGIPSPKEMRLQLTSTSFASSQAGPSKRSLTSGSSPEMRASKRRREETV
ncbi:hypothetical protein BD779DRAFT_347432 [Infundibulicybe gibba]|nr:hypothetical protein BD779DRAFT_347432 [Infundibulicybe gibba]